MVQEDLLERGLAAGERSITALACASAAISGADAPGTSKRSAFGPALSTLTPASGGSWGAGPANVTSTVCAPRWRSSCERSLVDEPALAQDPHAVAQRLDLAEDVRGEEHGLPALLGLPHALAEDHLHQRVQAAGRLIEQQQIGAGGEGGDQLHLLAVALRQRADLLARVELEALDQRIAIGDVDAAVQPREELERLRARQRRPQERLAGDVGDAAMRGAPGHARRRRRTAPRGRRSGGAAPAAAGSWSSCRPRWAPDSRTPRPRATVRSSASSASVSP